MIKILMCTMSLDIGGAETHITELCKVLTRRGYEVTVASNGGVYVEELVRADVKHVKLPLHSKKPSSVFCSYRGLKQLIRKEKFDIVHAHARIPAFVCGLLSKKLKFRFVTTAHGAFDINLLWKLISNWGEKTLAVSFDIKDYLTRNYGVPADNIGLTVNGIDTCKFSPSTDPSDVIEEFSLPESAHRILHVCRLDQASISVGRQLIQAAPQLVLRYPDVQIMIVGAGTAYGRLQAEAARVNREAGRDVVVLTGARTDVQKFCAWAEVFVGVSRAALEAMSAGCLAILSGNPEYNQGYTGIFRSDGLQSALDTNFTCRGSDCAQQGRLCEDICTLFSLPDEEKAQMRAYNRSVVCEYYSIEKMADDAVHMYESVTPYRRYRYGEILINGYYGFGNTGDDSLLHVIIEQIKAENKNARITVLSRSPKETARTHCVDSVNRFHPIALIRSLRHAKVLIYGGGSLLQSATSSRSLAYYLYLLRAARAADVRTVLFANGIGPFSSEQDEKRAARAMESVDLITLRDSTSFATVRAMGVKNEHIYLSADPAFTMHGSGKRWCAHLLRSAHLPAGREYFAVSLRAWKQLDKEFSRKIEQFCKEVTAKYNLTPLFIPMQDERDLALCSSLSSQTGGLCLRGLSCTEVRTIIAGARFVCGMRLHLLIYAVAEAVPAIGLSYDPKIDAFFRDIGCSRIMSASDIDGQRLFAFAQEALVRDKDVLTQKAQEMARRSKISMQKLKELLEQ